MLHKQFDYSWNSESLPPLDMNRRSYNKDEDEYDWTEDGYDEDYSGYINVEGESERDYEDSLYDQIDNEECLDTLIELRRAEFHEEFNRLYDESIFIYD